MGLVDWRIVVAVGVVGLLVLLIGLRGKRVDLLPRCRRRWCRYDLSAFIDAERPDEGYPVTCPECGHVAQGVREVKWGTRRARKRVAWFGAVVLALSAMVGGVEVYARATNANTLAWMPLWLILDRAEHDSLDNAYAHQVELLNRVSRRRIDRGGADRVIAQILEWQTDEAVRWGPLGDVFAALVRDGYATEADVERFWDNVWLLSVQTRETAVEGEWAPVMVHGRWRGHIANPLTLAGEDPVALPTAADAPDQRDEFELKGTIVITQEGLPPVRYPTGARLLIIKNQSFRSGEWEYHWGLEGDHSGDGWLANSFRSFVAGNAGGAASVAVECSVTLEDVRKRYRLSYEDPPDELDTAARLSKLGVTASWPVTAQRRIEIVSADRGEVRLAPAPGVREHIETTLRVSYRDARPHAGVVFGMLSIDSWVFRGPGWVPPSGDAPRFSLAHRVFLRLPNGDEVATEMTVFADGGLEGFRVASGRLPMEWFADEDALPAVVLRPDPAAARTVVGMDEIWDGVIELPITIKARDEETKEMYRRLLEREQEMRRSRSSGERPAP